MKRHLKTPGRPMSRQERKEKIVQHLAPMRGRCVYNKNLRQPVKFTRKGIDEIGQHGKYNESSMRAAMDAANQARKSVKQRETNAKKNGKQKQMGLKKMITLKGKYKGMPTKVNIGKTVKGEHRIYSVTVKRRKG